MPRVCIDESAFPSTRRVASYLGVNRFEALGLLLVFWKNSQAEERTHCTEEDIPIWLEDPLEFSGKDFLTALEQAGFVEFDPKQQSYLIRGNWKHIAALLQRRAAGRQNGKSGGRPKKNPPVKGSRKPLFCAVRSVLNKEPPNPLDQPSIQTVTKAWLDTLKHFGVSRSLNQYEDVLIARAIQRHGVDSVVRAMIGARHEPKTDNFDPAQHVSLTRILGHKHFDKNLNRGIRAESGVTSEQRTNIEALLAEEDK